MKNTGKPVVKLVYAAVCLALAMVLPLLIGQIPQIGQALSPMHIPVLLCGFLCGWPYGLAVGFIAPLLRFAIFGMPPIMPTGVAMAFELATYGCLTGLLYHLLPKKIPSIYVTLIAAMIGGRIVWGIARFVLAGLTASEFPMAAFIAGAVTNAIPGIILHIVLVPAIVIAMQRAKIIPND
ncbi:MAG: ECF transporter S component [Oscillospiraceae bacterium]|nr:ECF transporter S component [Oscillospiraceae bacterium]